MASARRLAAIMFTDTVGYTAATHADEGRSLDLLHQQSEIVRPLVGVHHGRVIKSTGDGFLVEFDSALKATQCALSIQRRLAERNAEGGLAPIRIRIGIHLGDVVQTGTDILGDAVNIAARIEPMAEPGGICVSGAVYDEVRNKVPDRLEKLPSAVLKGLDLPMDLYRVVLPWSEGRPGPRGSGPARLAVLPFDNISPDPRDEYFADGLTEELITTLSQLQGLRVIARTSVRPYKAAPKPIPQVGAELGVDAVLEGSVRKAGEQLRITIQLIDVSSQEHRWAESYDRKLDDIFAVQSEVAKHVAQALRVRLGGEESRRLDDLPTIQPESYLAYVQGRSLLATGWSEEIFRAAREQFERAISIDPTNARAYAGLSDAIVLRRWGHYGDEGQESRASSRTFAARAVDLEPNLAEAHCALALVHIDSFRYPDAEKELKRALSLNPSYAFARRAYARLLLEEGRPDEALRELSLAEELDPQSAQVLLVHAMALSWLRRADEAKRIVERLGRLAPDSVVYHRALGWEYYARDELPKMVEAWDRAEALSLPEERGGVHRAYLLAHVGKAPEALVVLEEASRKGGARVSPEDLVLGYALAGDLDASFRVLFDTLDREEPLMFQQLRIDPTLDSFRRDRRFTQFLQRVNLA